MNNDFAQRLGGIDSVGQRAGQSGKLRFGKENALRFRAGNQLGRIGDSAGSSGLWQDQPATIAPGGKNFMGEAFAAGTLELECAGVFARGKIFDQPEDYVDQGTMRKPAQME